MEKPAELVWAEFGSNLKRFILKRVGDEQAADDILQDTFVKIHTHLDSLQDESKLQSWVYQITRNAVVDYYRKQKISLPLDQDMAQGSPADSQVEAELASSVREMIECLPDEYRIPLIYDTFEGCTQAEIAARLGISYSAAKSRIQRARAKLRDLLFECCHFEFDRRGSVIDYHPRENCCRQCSSGPNVTFSPI